MSTTKTEPIRVVRRGRPATWQHQADRLIATATSGKTPAEAADTLIRVIDYLVIARNQAFDRSKG